MEVSAFRADFDGSGWGQLRDAMRVKYPQLQCSFFAPHTGMTAEEFDYVYGMHLPAKVRLRLV